VERSYYQISFDLRRQNVQGVFPHCGS